MMVELVKKIASLIQNQFEEIQVPAGEATFQMETTLQLIGLLQDITDTTNGVNQFFVKVAINLFAEIINVDINNIGE